MGELPVPKREATKALNRQLILEAARRVFAELGYGATTVRDIIRQTGLASGTFYNYFRSKEEVHEAILDESAHRIRPRLRSERLCAKTAEEFVRGTYRVFFEFVAADQRGFAVIRNQSIQPHVRMDTPEILLAFGELRNDIDAAMARGVLPPVDSTYLMSAMAGIAFEVGNRMLERDPIDVEGATSFATALVLGGLKTMKTSC